jgi:hypothetical protein
LVAEPCWVCNVPLCTSCSASPGECGHEESELIARALHAVSPEQRRRLWQAVLGFKGLPPTTFEQSSLPEPQRTRDHRGRTSSGIVSRDEIDEAQAELEVEIAERDPRTKRGKAG